ncbi:RNA polymerase sigma-70 factor (ECF subfamily) [Alteromonadaceae bacterium 2753L.S.0a.02]|nr:RNA polymerase sigma-70 factor (ECF subfamily) [Alteromonadaceae bacterium 2753L.S.0a.02]
MKINQHAFELAVHAYSDDLYRYAYWLCKHQSDAEDLVQECFHRAWNAWHTLKDEKAVKSWLFTILRREFLRRFEKIRIDLDSLDDHLELPALEPGQDEILALRQALHQAPVNLREPLLLQVLGGFSCEEIAEMQQTSSGAVMTRLSRARHWLRRSLNPGSELEEAKR